MTSTNRSKTIRIGQVGPWRADLDGRRKFVSSVSDPSMIPGNYDLLVVTFVDDIPAEWVDALARALVAGTRVRHLGEYLETEHRRIIGSCFQASDGQAARHEDYRIRKAGIERFLILMTSPLTLTIGVLLAVAIFVSMGRPILFHQTRVGLNGATFELIKFRTMTNRRGGAAVTVAGDARVTRLGRLLRHLHADELPQLVHVFQGCMSLVGPRPEQLALSIDYILSAPAFALRVLVLPGITGWAQIRSGYAGDLTETMLKLESDLFYIKHQSLMLDAVILLRTLGLLFLGPGGR